MEDLDVRILRLAPMRVAYVSGFGESPELDAIGGLLDWARAKGLLEEGQHRRFFGHNNPSPSAGSPNYGYDFWMTVGPGVEPDGDVKVKDFEGGLYAVTRCKGVENITPAWQALVRWGEGSKYQLAHHQWLEEHITVGDVPLEELELDLYMPVTE